MPSNVVNQEHQNRIPTVVLAMPGLGKSTFCQTHDSAVDDDFGSWCQARGLNAYQLDGLYRQELARSFAREVIIPDLHAGRLVLTNEPRVWRYLPAQVAILAAVPSQRFMPKWFAAVVERTVSEAPDELNDPDSFLKHYLRDGLRWPSGDEWRIPGVPLFEVDSHDQFVAILEALV